MSNCFPLYPLSFFLSLNFVLFSFCSFTSFSSHYECRQQEAVAQENVEMIELLLKHGANLNVQDNEGWTPLHAVCQYGFPEVVKLLLSKNADTLVTNFDNDLPIDLIEEDEELQAVVEGLLSGFLTVL